MRCPGCGSDNPDGAKFCDECAAPLPAPCPACGAPNRAGAKFCNECAAPLSGAVAAIASAASSPASQEQPVPAAAVGAAQEAAVGERKTVTALFADIKGSTELMADLDPEDARALIDPALQLMAAAVRRYDGYVVQSTGDGLFAMFGAPVAREDHPQRALHAAIRMQEELRAYADRLRSAGGAPVEIRVGVDTGEMVMRTIVTGGHPEYTPIGHTANLASRLQSLARTGSIVVSENTRKLVEGYFALKPLGPTRIRGVADPVNIYEVTGVGPLRTRLQASARRGLTRFVGRDLELAHLKHALELADAGHGQVVAAVGEAGAGKSRLFFEFKAIAQSGHLVLETISFSHGKAAAWTPVIELLRGYFQITPEDDLRRRREKVTGRLLTLDRGLEDALPYLFALMGLQEGEDAYSQMDPQVRRRRTHDAIKRIIMRESLSQPLMVIFEDLHWTDSETQALLNVLVDGVANARVLLAVNYRPEFTHGWANRTHYTQLRLDPLGTQSADEMLGALLGGDPSVAPLKRLIIDKAQGNPFFMEEMVQAVFEQGALERATVVRLKAPLAEIRVPLTVQGVLTSRIDRLPAAEKELLQVLAVAGKEFPLSLIRRVVEKSGEELERMLTELQLREFIHERPAARGTEYAFKHALSQEVAYNSLLLARRKVLHERTAAAIEELFQARLEDHYDELARHYRRGGNAAKALQYLELAGAQAWQKSANLEAVEHFTAALELLGAMPDTPQRARQELSLQLGMGPALQSIKGFAAPEVERVFTRARELCSQIGEANVFPVLLGLQEFYGSRGEWHTAGELAGQCLELAERNHDPDLILEANHLLVYTLAFRGEPAAAAHRLEQVVRLYDPAAHRSHAVLYGHDPYVCSCVNGSSALWLLGYPERAQRISDAGMARARELSHPFTTGLALLGSAFRSQLCGEETALERAQALLDFGHELGVSFFTQNATAIIAARHASAGDPAGAIKPMEEAIAAIAETGSRLLTPFMLALLAEVYARADQSGQALAVLADAIAMADQTGEQLWLPDLHRLKGDILLAHSAVAKAEASFQQALTTARAQHAKSLELRATMSIARHLAADGKRGEARQHLTAIYAWFTEGFATADLQQAKALLDELK